MKNRTLKSYTKQLSLLLPSRHKAKTGRPPLPKELLVKEYMRMIKYGLGWRDIRHPSSVRRYISECQRRGCFKKVMQDMSGERLDRRNKVSITDACELQSWHVSKETPYSGKQKGYAAKITLELTDDYKIRDIRFAKSYHHDIWEWEKMLETKHLLPYVWYLDKGYFSLTIRKNLRKLNCQVKTPPKEYKHRHAKGKKIQWGEKENKIRTRIERFFAWMQSFRKVRERRERQDALFHAHVYVAMTYYLYRRRVS